MKAFCKKYLYCCCCECCRCSKCCEEEPKPLEEGSAKEQISSMAVELSGSLVNGREPAELDEEEEEEVVHQ
jgi:hypothetical protein